MWTMDVMGASEKAGGLWEAMTTSEREVTLQI